MNTSLRAWSFFLAIAIGSAPLAQAADAANAPKPVPANRAQMLAALEALKSRTPRLPLPKEAAATPPAQVTPPAQATAPTQSPAAASATPAQATAAQRSPATGSLGVVNNGLMRNHYLPAELRSGGFSRKPDPAMTLDQVFSVELFWIVSRVNNCHYCLGHQEAKLKAAGVSDAQLLELDTNWKKFSPAQQAAFAFTRKLTYAPHAVTAEDLDRLRAHFNDQQILEIAFLVGRYNSTNRWTDSLGIPQEEHRDFQSNLPQDVLALPSQVAVEGFPARVVESDFDAWQANLAKAAQRTSRLPLVHSSESAANYERLLATFPVSGQQWIEQVHAARVAGALPPALKAKIAFVAACADQAWYMQHRSLIELHRHGLSDRQAFALAQLAARSDADSTQKTATKQEASVKEQAASLVAVQFAHKLTATPQAMADADIERLLQHYTPPQVAEIVYHVGIAAFLDRVTETAGLGWKDEPVDNLGR